MPPSLPFGHFKAVLLKSSPGGPGKSCIPNQTHLNKLVKVFTVTEKLQVGEVDHGLS